MDHSQTHTKIMTRRRCSGLGTAGLATAHLVLLLGCLCSAASAFSIRANKHTVVLHRRAAARQHRCLRMSSAPEGGDKQQGGGGSSLEGKTRQEIRREVQGAIRDANYQVSSKFLSYQVHTTLHVAITRTRSMIHTGWIPCTCRSVAIPSILRQSMIVAPL
jgi:hypothetical protein